MRSFLAALAFIVVVAVGGALILDTFQVQSANRYATGSVRLEAAS
jgi:hypothetical protein